MTKMVGCSCSCSGGGGGGGVNPRREESSAGRESGGIERRRVSTCTAIVSIVIRMRWMRAREAAC